MDILLQGDGRIVMAGTSWDGSSLVDCRSFARLNADGSPVLPDPAAHVAAPADEVAAP